jgi:hypothetical protein
MLGTHKLQSILTYSSGILAFKLVNDIVQNLSL